MAFLFSVAQYLQGQSLQTSPGAFTFVETATDVASQVHTLPTAHPNSSFRAFNVTIVTENGAPLPSDFQPQLVMTYPNGKTEIVMLYPFQEVESLPSTFKSDLVYMSTKIKSYHLIWTGEALPLLKITGEWFDPGAVTSRQTEVVDPSPSLRSNCSVPLPKYVDRVSWNCPSGAAYTTPPASYTQVTHLIIHHSAGVNTSTNWGQVVLSIWNYHVNSNKWSDIAYNWLVDPNGVVYEGRGGGDNVLGAHFCGYNAGTMGVCMLGNFQQVEVSQKAFDNLLKVLTWKACARNLDPNQIAFHPSSGLQLYRVSGHRDGCSTECPGDNLYKLLPQIRSRISSVLNPSTGIDNRIGNSLQVTIYPNPVRPAEKVWVQVESKELKNGLLALLDTQGQLLYQQLLSLQEGKNNLLLNLPALAPGNYWLRWQDRESAMVFNQKLTVVD
jgi:hypothetical protein